MLKTTSNQGADETQRLPKQLRDPANSSMRAMDSNFRKMNSSLLSVARNVGVLQGKISKVDAMNGDLAETKERLTNLETTLSVHTKILTDIFERLKAATDPEPEEPVVNNVSEDVIDEEPEDEEDLEIELDDGKEN